MQNLGLKNPILGKFTGKIEILSTHNDGILQLSVGKLQLLATPTLRRVCAYYYYDAAGRQDRVNRIALWDESIKRRRKKLV